MENEENKYYFARELIFELRATKAISEKVYLHYVDKLIKDEKNHGVSHHVSKCECDNDHVCGICYKRKGYKVIDGKLTRCS